jgi:hypothetical protein
MNLPATMIEAEAIPVIKGWTAYLPPDWMTGTESNHRIIRQTIKDRIRQGETEVGSAVDAARAGDVYADHALRELGAEMFADGDDLPERLKEYVIEALLRPPHPFPPGRNDLAHHLRNNVLVRLVAQAMQRWNLNYSQNRESDGQPSASYLVAKTFDLSEDRLAKLCREHHKALRNWAAKASAGNPVFDAYDPPEKL